MNQCDRIKLILREHKLKQKQLAAALGITESYISKLLKDPNIRLSQPLATLIEERYGYCAGWVLNGEGPKLRKVNKSKGLSELRQEALARLEKMDGNQVKATLAFIAALDDIEKSFSSSE